MGLDMYLNKRTYVKNWDHMEPHELTVAAISGPRAVGVKPERISYVEEEVLYWRKANAIHAWFVANVQNGVDECQTSEVSREQLAELAALCRQVLADPTQAEELLPPQSGFFFGSTEIDEWYLKDLQRTADSLDALLAEPEPQFGSTYQYEASW